MSHSNLGAVENVTRLLLKLNPRTVLDVGIGFGLYGYMSRMWLDARRDEVWKGVNFHKWSRRVDGIEPYRPFADAPQNEWLYDEILKFDALTAIKGLKGLGARYDLIILSHVLEHMPKGDGEEVLALALAMGENVIVGLPRDCSHETDPYDYDNPYGPHVSDWGPDFEILKVRSSKWFLEEGEHYVFWLRGEQWEDRSLPGWEDRFREPGA